jgi:TRAP-type C4-dicarboxylate transport system permease small subunit
MKLFLRLLSWASAVAGGLIAMAVGFMTLYSIMQRALFSRPLTGDIELVQFGIALSISLSIGWCQLNGANITVDFFTEKCRPSINRWLDGLGCFLIAVMYGVLSVRTLYGALAVQSAHETTPTLDLPMWWVYACLAPGLAVGALVALCQTWMHFTQQDLNTLNGPSTDKLTGVTT